MRDGRRSASERPGPGSVPPPAAVLRLRGRAFDAARPAVMAIVNRTDDSFWAGARHADPAEALAAVDRAVEDGADLVDVGGVRAGAEGAQVTAQQEIDRVLPVLVAARERHPELILSLDTWRTEVASVATGFVDLVNDTWAGHDPHLAATAARIGAGYVVSHTGGLPPRTDPVAVRYSDGGSDEDAAVVASVLATLDDGARRAVAAG